MAESVVYADLRFAKVPVGRSSPCPAPDAAPCEDEAESPYENVQPGKAPAGQDAQGVQPATGPWYQRRSVPAGLLAACVLLLATLLTLGLCYWQVSRRLQDASRAHAAEHGRLSQHVQLQEQSLEQAREEQEQTRLEREQTWLELARTRAELQRAWLEGNSSRRELGQRDAELERVAGVLGTLREELRGVQGKLNASESTVSSLRACVHTECCPAGWVLYRGKCLFVSSTSKTWRDSKSDCEKKSALLLVQEPWERWELPDFMTAQDAEYWIGVIFQYWGGRAEWLDKSSSVRLYNSFLCGKTTSGKIERSPCSMKLPWVCEKAPVLSSTSDALFPRVVKGWL